ncbi:AAA domain-containing protein [Frateuria hangzhouensis]|uniref:AAA domain-containing protein n=1 Tax=Frateuria hangzhouensis TaxID=2995589 RepID=UPI002260AEC1|nr:AAA domain-containing protein [Frateuria sp. STR12]MCX7514986.1 AAA domain-containing protein [Frateuria sp. STR12]
MDIEIWDGGLQEQEIEAIHKIKAAFADVRPTDNSRGGVNSLKEQLRQQFGRSRNHAWKGYAGFRFVDSRGREGEFDLVIVTHCNIIIVELKDWNHEPVTADGDIWFKGSKNMGRSPVSVTRNKKFLLENKIKKISSRFTNKKYPPRVYFYVVMTGNADFSQLPEVDRQHTISLKDFLRLSDRGRFNDVFRPHPDSQVLDQDIPVFDEMFLGRSTAPKALKIGGYTAIEEIFEHPKLVYKEYLASSETSKGAEALLRVWNFKKLQGNKAFTPEGRAEIVSREREVLRFIGLQNRDLYNHCLRSLTGFEKEQVTSQHSEVYELPPGHVRFNEFIGRYGNSFSIGDRLNLTKLLLSKFGDLHDVKVAHRDIADHSLWLSPSKEIALSNFISAYHKPIGTVGDFRESLSVGALEVKEMLDASPSTPFRQDVHALGLVSWHLLTGQRMSPKSLANIQDEMLASNHWYAGVLLDAVSGSFEDAAAFFDAFKRAEPAGEAIPTFDDSELEPYRHSINHTRQFPEQGDFVVSTDDKEVYFSQGRLVKAWLNAGGRTDDPARNFRVLAFLRRLDKLASVNPAYLPRILEYGLAARSGSMYLVTERVDGATWIDAQVDGAGRLDVIRRLVDAIEHLHSLGISHGDLHPGNVMLDRSSGNLYLVDTPDFSHNTGDIRNHLYSPENIDDCSSEQRDIFAVLRMSSELLELEWGRESSAFPGIAHAIQSELADVEFGFRSLGRFKKALTAATGEQEERSIEITLTHVGEPVAILPDNGHVYVKIEMPRKGRNHYPVTFSGVGGSFVAFYDKDKRDFVAGTTPRVRSGVGPREIEESQLEVNAAIRIKPGRPEQLSGLSEYLRSDDAFLRAFEMLHSAPAEIDGSGVSKQLKDLFDNRSASVPEGRPGASFDIPTQALWRAILATETESSPNIELNGASITPSDVTSELILPYEADNDPLGAFASTDEVEALLIDKNGAEKVIGEVLLKKSALNEVRLHKLRFSARGLRDGELVYFRSKADRASYRKRKAALERLLDREGVLSDLVDLFDPGCTKVATSYDIAVTDEDFAKYDREDQQGNKISLNEQQRQAFVKLLNHGPLSLLQGPPGTGKTEFIAAFVHYLVEKMGARRILLVSQSHEAVNTAAERIRKHCGRLGTPLEAVRFSNREGAVSHGLKDVYSHAITAERRELFNAEYRYRAAALADALGLEAEFISKVLDVELKLFKRIDHLESLLKNFEEVGDEEDAAALKPILVGLDEAIRAKLRDEYGVSLSQESRVSEAKSILISKLCSEYGVRPNETRRVRALARLSRDIQDALSADRVNCDEFYARSRQLVTGTCVGIGQAHIGIQENIYDFVIIDEAARSISSELAIAMQSAKRVLLVGDHLQLPPLYSDAHKAALARRLGINDKHVDLDEVLRSDFARAFNSEYGKQASATLLTQYRMAPPIGNLVSRTFYDGRLDNGVRVIPGIYHEAPPALRSPVTWLDTSALGEHANHQDDRGVSIYNRCEAEQVIEVLRQISDSGQFLADLSELKDKDDALIGVICMYAEQKRLIRQKFTQGVWNDGFKALVKIDTVDSYQGKENRIIILSLTRSDKRRSAGFLRMPNRINVAMSRAMDRLLIVGNADIWRTNNRDRPLGQVVAYMDEMGEGAGYKFIPAKRKR